jgi:hypothetical protein
MSGHDKLKSEHTKLRDEHERLGKRFDNVTLKCQKLSSRLDEMRVGAIASPRVVELEECLAAECKLTDELRASGDEKGDDGDGIVSYTYVFQQLIPLFSALCQIQQLKISEMS